VEGFARENSAFQASGALLAFFIGIEQDLRFIDGCSSCRTSLPG